MPARQSSGSANWMRQGKQRAEALRRWIDDDLDTLAKAVGKGVVDPDAVTLVVVAGGVGASLKPLANSKATAISITMIRKLRDDSSIIW